MAGAVGLGVEACPLEEVARVGAELFAEVLHGFLERLAEAQEAELGQRSGHLAVVDRHPRVEAERAQEARQVVAAHQHHLLLAAVAADDARAVPMDDLGHELGQRGLRAREVDGGEGLRHGSYFNQLGQIVQNGHARFAA